ncbi:cytochrome P450 [Mycobacterium sp. 050134]|uniref:cytochrome P450 n=1 Tax=Mycobacterium sp. 050134 TaxID=3096111 RepID=UPI002ED7BA3F
MRYFAPPPPPFVEADRSLIAANPRAHWRALQGSPVFLDASGYYYVTRREDVLAALHDYTTFASRRRQMARPRPGVRTLPIPVPIGYDPPEHSRFRRLLHPFFSPQAVAELMPELRRQAAELIGSVAPDGACDGIRDVANPFPFGVLVTLCGLPWSDREMLATWAEAVDWDVPGSAPAAELLDYLVTAIESDEPPALAAHLQSGADPFTEDEVIGFYALLCFAQDGMQAGIGSALLHLACDRDLQNLLRREPDQMWAFVEELLRLETPLPFIGRFTTRDVTIAGVTIPAGCVVRLCLASTNLDGSEEAWVTVAEDGRIRPKSHRSFAAGVHRCLGKALARMELSVVVSEWLSAIPDFTLEEGFTPRFLFTQGGSMTLAGLPLQWGNRPPR